MLLQWLKGGCSAAGKLTTGLAESNGRLSQMKSVRLPRHWVQFRGVWTNPHMKYRTIHLPVCSALCSLHRNVMMYVQGISSSSRHGVGYSVKPCSHRERRRASTNLHTSNERCQFKLYISYLITINGQHVLVTIGQHLC